MRKLLISLMLLGLFAPGPLFAGHGGGGVHYIIVSIHTPGVSRATPGPVVEMPTEITDAPVSRMEGQMGKGETIALHTLRAMDAIVLLEAVQGRRGAISAGRVLTKLIFRQGAVETSVYCDLGVGQGDGGHYQWDCFSDSRGDGKLDSYWLGRDGDAFLGLWTDASEMDWKRNLVSPAAYRVATPEERPTGLIGYAWCGGDGIGTPPRFTVSANWQGGYFETAEAQACNFGDWVDPSAKGAERIDRINAVLRPGAQAKTLEFKVESRIAPGPIERLQPNGGIVALSEAKAEADQTIEELKEPPFRPAGGPGTAARGEIPKGGVFYSVAVKHSITGVLTNEVRTGSYSFFVGAAAHPGEGLPPGQIMYGALVGGGIEPQIVWCAPQKTDGGRWSDAICLPNNGTGNLFVRASPAMMGAANITLTDHLPPYVAAPIVERRDIDLPPMILSYAFAGWDGPSLKVETKLDWGDGPKLVQVRRWLADSNGEVRLPVPGGEITVTRLPRDDSVVSVGSFAANAR